jgi:hypothetical protein
MPSLLDDIRGIVDSVDVSPGALENTLSATDRVASRLIESALQGTVAGLSEADSAVIALRTQAMTRLVGASDALGILGANMLAERMFTYQEQAANRLPGPFRHVAKIFASARVRNKVLRERILVYLAERGPHMIRDTALVNQLSGLYNDPALGIGHAANPPANAPVKYSSTNPALQAAINHMERQIQTLAYSLGIAQHSGGVPQQVWNAIQTNQKAIAAINIKIVEINNRLNETASNTASVQNQISNLASEIHGIRTVNEGWQDVLDELQKHVTTLTQTYNHAESQIHTQGQQIQQLAPLAVLLAAGATGLKVLRQLQKTPCMCPKPPRFGNIPNELGTALAVELVVAHGF